MEYFETFSSFVLGHAAFFAAAAILAYIGHFTAKVFTRARAYYPYSEQWKHYIAFYGRETLPTHPVLLGALLGAFWRAPEGVFLPIAGSVLYFAAAGVVGMGAWVLAKAVAKQRGLELEDPWMSLIPPSMVEADITSVNADEEPTNPQIKLPALSEQIHERLMRATRGTSP